jgi:serine protease Do
MRSKALMSLCCLLPVPAGHAATDIPGMFAGRERTIVFIEYYTQREIDRQAGEGIGLVVSDDGHVVCLPHVFSEWIPPDRFRDIRVYAAGNPVAEGFEADYLGQDWVNGWHYIRIRDMQAAGQHLVPINRFDSGVPQLGDTVWGVCMTAGDLDYVAYYREAKLSTIQPLPLDTGFATSEVAVPGGPVFLADGRFAGWAGRSLPMERDLWVGQDYFRANIRNPDESLMFLLAEPFYAELLQRVPKDPLYHERPWIGISNTQPLDKETARFMGLTGRGAIIISEVLEDTPAQRAGLQDRDLLLKINGKPLPHLKPDSVLQMYFERELLISKAGEPVTLTVLRGDAEVDVTVVPERAPTLMKEAALHYFDQLGLTIRQYIMADALRLRENHRDLRGAMVNFIRPNSLAATGEVLPGDWIVEVGGQPVKDFADTKARIEALLADDTAAEVVLLVRRGNDTAVLRIRKK